VQLSVAQGYVAIAVGIFIVKVRQGHLRATRPAVADERHHPQRIDGSAQQRLNFLGAVEVLLAEARNVAVSAGLQQRGLPCIGEGQQLVDAGERAHQRRKLIPFVTGIQHICQCDDVQMSEQCLEIDGRPLMGCADGHQAPLALFPPVGIEGQIEARDDPTLANRNDVHWLTWGKRFDLGLQIRSGQLETLSPVIGEGAHPPILRQRQDEFATEALHDPVYDNSFLRVSAGRPRFVKAQILQVAGGHGTRRQPDRCMLPVVLQEELVVQHRWDEEHIPLGI